MAEKSHAGTHSVVVPYQFHHNTFLSNVIYHHLVGNQLYYF